MAANGIDEEAFELLDDATIKEIIPIVGVRLKFQKKYQEFKGAAQPAKVSHDYVCFKCLKRKRGIHQLFHHLNFYHHINSGTATNIVCQEPDCFKTFTYCKTYKRHMLQNHYRNDLAEIVHVDELEPVDDENDPEFENDHRPIIDDEDLAPQVESVEDLKHNIAIFLSSLKSKGIPTSTIQHVVGNVEELIDTTVGQITRKIDDLKGAFSSGTLQEEAFGNVIDDCDDVKDIFQDIKSDHNLLKYLEEQGFLISPKTKVLDYVYDARINNTSGRMEQVQKKESFQYIPLEQLLHAYLSQPGMMKSIIANQSKEPEDGILSSYLDGQFYRQSFKEEGEFIIPLLLYSDDFETGNPLGSQRGVHKVCAFYCSVLSIPKRNQGNLNNILLVALAKTKLISNTEHGIDSVLKVIIDEMQTLYNNKLFIDVPGEFQGFVKPK